MKKLVVILFLSAMIASCGSNDNAAKTDQPKTDTVAVVAPPSTSGVSAEDEKGLELIGSNDCTACHAIDRKIIGPAYIDVSKKYASTDAVIDSLVYKVRNGGMGNWGNIPMTAHPDLSDADARTMVKYILSLKDKK